ncbi:MAG: cyclic nucleotide-binding domain-containing protein [Micavibrio sp.]|nr:cyclic nucleotide-binding domain-containing protein [Micavibrio sp.]
MDKSVLERKVFHKGQKILLPMETHSNAYLIQRGEVKSYTVGLMGETIEVGQYREGNIIGETNLIIDTPTPLTFEAVNETTVVILSRQEFEKKLSSIDTSILNVIIMMIQKLKTYEHESMDQAIEKNRLHGKASEIVEHLIRDMNGPRKERYRDVMQPHFNILCNALEDLKQQEEVEKMSINLAQEETNTVETIN